MDFHLANAFGSPAILGSDRGHPNAEEARTRGFPAPAFAGCGFFGALKNMGSGEG
jgi:hypothetical protein